MKKRLFSILLASALICSGLGKPVRAEAGEASPQPKMYTDGEYIEGTAIVTVVSPKKTSLTKEGTASFDSGITIEECYDFGSAGALAQTGGQRGFLSDKTLYISEVSSNTYSTRELINKLDDKAYVIAVEPDYKQYLNDNTGDPLAHEQWHLDGGGSFSGQSAGISFASTKSMEKKNTPVIAVMDTGIDHTHEDLADHMWVNPNTALLPGMYGYNFTDDTADCRDTNGHGTHCAGTIAAVSGNGKGITGISEARLMSLKIFDEERSTSNSIIIKALNYIIQAKAAGVNITAVNCSWGGGNSSYAMPSLVKQIGQGGTLFIFASGNEGINHRPGVKATCPYDLYTGSYTENRNYMVITGSSDVNDMPSSFSDYGASDVDLFAPGENILSTYPEEIYFPGVYQAEVETQLTSSLLRFDDSGETAGLYTDREVGVQPVIPAETAYEPDIDYRSNASSGCLKWTIDLNAPNIRQQTAYLYMDVTDEQLDPEAVYYVSMLFGGTDSDGIFSWDHVTRASSGKLGSETNRFYVAPDGTVYFKVIGLEPNSKRTGTMVYYLDDIGISRANPDTSLFGKYEATSGTSMAAPMVTGAAALLSQVYPGDSVKNRKGRLLACTRQTQGITGKCVTGGVLDLQKMNTYVPVPEENNTTNPPPNPQATVQTKKQKPKVKVKKIKIKASKKTLKAGKKLSLRAVVTPSGASSKKVKWTSSKKKWATVTQRGYVTAKKKGRGHTVRITATATDGSRKKASVRIKIKK